MDLSVIERFETPAKVLRLSDAIRIGAKIRPQCQVKFFQNGGSCAFGAAFEATHGYPLPDGSGFTEAGKHGFRPGKLFGISGGMKDEIYERNDRGETRESIADWLEANGY